MVEVLHGSDGGGNHVVSAEAVRYPRLLLQAFKSKDNKSI
jgi:hypothetical protein